MRTEIKFRAWHNEAKEYFEGPTSHMFILAEEGQPVELEQYTGLHDCDGVKIFDGDIVEYHPYHNCGHIQEKRVGEVRYRKTCDYDGFLNCKHYEYVVSGNSLADIADSDYKESAYCKVIGNIHQNPELLEAK